MRRIVVGSVLVFLLLASLFTEPSRAVSPIYVRADGDDVNCNGTSNSPYPGGGPGLNCAVKTISKGVELVDPSGIVYVAQGSFSEYVYINKPLSLVGAGASLTEIASITDKISVDGAAVTVRGFTIRHASENGIKYYNGASGTIENNIIKENGTGIRVEKANVTIRNNTITGNETGITAYGEYDTNDVCTTWALVNTTGNTISGNTGTGISNSSCARVTITNNLVIGNGHTGIYSNAGEVGNEITITNNTIVANGEEGISNIYGTTATITNNIITSNGMNGIYADGWSAAVCTYNDVWGNSNDDPGGPGTGSISADPLFVSATDLHLQCAVPGGISPAFNAGNNAAPGIPTVDKDGNPRIMGARVDMGAYENHCFVTVTPPLQMINSQMTIVARANIVKATDIVSPQATSLLDRAKEKGLDASTCEKLIDEAHELLDLAKKNLTNPIYANTLALEAQRKLNQAIDCLKALLG